jgi:peptidyl-prolyl cis-trans isomerase C
MLSGAIVCNSAFADQEAGRAHDVIAIVNGKEITSDQVNNIDLDALPPQKKKQLIESLINRQLLMEQAVKEGFDKQEHIVAAVKALAELHIVTQYTAKLAASFNVRDEELKSIYDVKYSSSSTEYKIRHILLATEKEGQALIAMLAKDDDFAQLAQKNSQDMVSAKKGGDLGWLTSKNIVPSLYGEISRLAKGEVSGSPVQSPFGWHVLKLEDIRKVMPPKFEAVKRDLRKQVVEKKLRHYLGNLRAKATIEIK